MKNLIYFLIIPFILIVSCKKDDGGGTSQNEDPEDPEITLTVRDCVFVQDDTANDGIIDDEEQAMMQECYENKLQDKTEIENTVIGEWELIGHGEGWIPTASQPCGYMTFTDDGMLTFEYADSGGKRTTTHTWEVIEADSNVEHYFYLNITDGVYGMGTSVICPNYMYSNATPVDGDMYLYRKVN